MSQGWKQIWDDIRSSLRSDASSDTPSTNVTQVDIEASTEVDLPAEASISNPDRLTSSAVSETSIAAAEATPEAGPESHTDEIIGLPQTLSERSVPSVWQRVRQNAVFLSVLGVAVVVILFLTTNSSALEPEPPAPDVIATFNSGQITIADLEAHLELLVPDEAQAALSSPYTVELVIQDLVTDELARQWAIERQPDSDETFAHTMEHITEEINLESFDSQLHQDASIVSESDIQDYYYANRDQFGDQTFDGVRDTIRQTLLAEREQTYIEEYVQRLQENATITRDFSVLSVPLPTETELQRYFDENSAQFMLPRQVTVDELEFPIEQDEDAARQRADSALLSIRSGAAFEQVVQENFGTFFSGAATIPAGIRSADWETVVFSLSIGEMSEVFRAGDSFFIVRLNADEAERAQTLNEVREFIVPIVQQQQTAAWFEQNAERTLFTIKGRRYTAGQFYQEYQELSPIDQAQFAGSEGMRDLAEQLIERLLLVEDTYDQLLDTQNQPLTDETRLQVLKQMLHQESVDDQIEVTEEEMQQFYTANQDMMVQPTEARIRYIRIGLGSSEDEAVRAQERANEVYNRLITNAAVDGAAFAALAQEYSEDPETAANGGELPGWIGEGIDLLAEMELHPFHERIVTLQSGEISPIFEFGDSLYIVQVIERTQPAVLTFDQVQPSIEEYLYQQKHEALSVELENTLLEEAGFIIYTSVLETYFAQAATSIP